jgi:hypothetical protein
MNLTVVIREFRRVDDVRHQARKIRETVFTMAILLAVVGMILEFGGITSKEDMLHIAIVLSGFTLLVTAGVEYLLEKLVYRRYSY